MSEKKLPPLSKLIFPAYLTITRGIKIGNNDIVIQEQFSNTSIDLKNLEAYRQYFDFKSRLPLTYIYIIAQRALLHLMLHKDFTIAVPGIVHISNEILLNPEFNMNEEFEIKSSMRVPVKEGSLFPTAVIQFYQNGIEVARNVSNYIAKRKSTQKRGKREVSESTFGVPSFTKDWFVKKSVGKSYAHLSNDKNPIHTSKLFAKIAGFKHPIAHGWYSVSRSVSTAEKQSKREFKTLHVAFNKPIYLPSNVQFELNGSDNFRITHGQKQYSYLEGELR